MQTSVEEKVSTIETKFHHEAYLHPILTPKGKILTDDYPSDHLWQRGLWFAWTKVKFQNQEYDFWNQGAKEPVSAKIVSKSVSLDPKLPWLRAEHAFVIYPATSNREEGIEILKETWLVEPYQFEKAHVLDLTSRQTNQTPHSIEFPTYHYGGLGFRTQLQDSKKAPAVFLTSEGLDRIEGNLKPARWVWLGEAERGAGALLLIHPKNFRYPQPLRLNPKQVQLSVAPSIGGDWQLAPQETLESRYRLIVLDEMPDKREMEKLWQDYSSSPQLQIKN